MPSYIEKAEEITLPVIALRGTVAFPAVTVNFEPSDEEAAEAAKAAGSGNTFIFLTSYNEIAESDNAPFPYYNVGTVAKIKQMIRTPEGQTRSIAEGFMRATVVKYRKTENHVEADLICKSIFLREKGGVRGEACVHEMMKSLEKNAMFLPTNTDDLINAARLIDAPGLLADFIAANILARNRDKQAVLECFDPLRRSEVVLEILESESMMLAEEAMLRRRVTARMSR